jgi:hypothetical protein
MITIRLQAAREACEAYSGRATVSTRYTQVLDRFPIFLGNEAIVGYPVLPAPIVHGSNIWPLSPSIVSIPLMRSPLISVQSFSYFDTQGNQQTLVENTDFVKDVISEPPRLNPVPSGFWPTTQYRAPAVTITFSAGYATAGDVPARMKLAILTTIAHFYENRLTVMEGGLREVPQSARDLLDQLSVKWEF